MKRLPITATAAVTAACLLGAAAPALAAGLPVISESGQGHFETGTHASMTLTLNVSGARSVSAQMTPYNYGAFPKPGLHRGRPTPRFALHHVHGNVWTATRHDNRSVEALMSDEDVVSVRACNAAGCTNATIYFHPAG